jgi:hypothetical protein
MIQRGDGLGLAVEAFTELRVARKVWRQDLERDRAVQPRIPRRVDFADSARADARGDR